MAIILYTVYLLHAYFIYSSLSLLILYPYLALLPFCLPTGNHYLFPISLNLFLFTIYILCFNF